MLLLREVPKFVLVDLFILKFCSSIYSGVTSGSLDSYFLILNIQNKIDKVNINKDTNTIINETIYGE